MNDSVIIVNSKKDLIEQGYISTNINKEIIYEGNNNGFIISRIYNGI